jgi:hypothetical protein
VLFLNDVQLFAGDFAGAKEALLRVRRAMEAQYGDACVDQPSYGKITLYLAAACMDLGQVEEAFPLLGRVWRHNPLVLEYAPSCAPLLLARLGMMVRPEASCAQARAGGL